jgi:hypothetical protein
MCWRACHSTSVPVQHQEFFLHVSSILLTCHRAVALCQGKEREGDTSLPATALATSEGLVNFLGTSEKWTAIVVSIKDGSCLIVLTKALSGFLLLLQQSRRVPIFWGRGT